MNSSFRIANRDDHDLVVQMLYELVLELSTSDEAARLRLRLDDDIRLALESSTIRIFLALVAGAPVGLGRADVLINDPIFRLRDEPRCGYVDQMYVRPNYRGRGLGRELLRRCEAWFRELGIGHVLLHAAPRALRFYEREGYQSNREMFKRL